MTCNTAEVLEKLSNGGFASRGWAGVSCRTESDWYVTTTHAGVVVDHLPNREAARRALSQYLQDVLKGYGSYP